MKLLMLAATLIFSGLTLAQDNDVIANLKDGESTCYSYSVTDPDGDGKTKIEIWNCHYKTKFVTPNKLKAILNFDFFSEFVGDPLIKDLKQSDIHASILMIKHPNKGLIDQMLEVAKKNDTLENKTKPVEIALKIQVYSIESNIVESFKLGLNKLTFGQGIGQDDTISAGDDQLTVGLKMGTAEVSAFFGAERVKGNIEHIKTQYINVNNRQGFYQKLQMPVFFNFPSTGQTKEKQGGLNISGTPSIDINTGDVYIDSLYLSYGILHENYKPGDVNPDNVENIEIGRHGDSVRIKKGRVRELFSDEEKAVSKNFGIRLLGFNKEKSKSMRKIIIIMSAEVLDEERSNGDIDPRLLPSYRLSKKEKADLPESGVSVQEFLNSFKLEPAFKKINGNARVRFTFDKSLLTKEILNKRVLVKFKGKGVKKADKKFYFDLEELSGPANFSPEVDLAFLKKNKSNVKLIVRERGKLRGAKIKRKLEFNPTTSNPEKTFYIKRAKSRKVRK